MALTLAWHFAKIPLLERWTASAGIAVVALISWVVIAGGSVLISVVSRRIFKDQFNSFGPEATRKAEGVLLGLLGLGFAFFLLRLGSSFAGAWIGEAVFNRWFGFGYPSAEIAAGIAVLVVCVGIFAREAWKRGQSQIDFFALAYFGLFCVVTTRPHERHRSLAVMLLAWSCFPVVWFVQHSSQPIGPPIETHWGRITDMSFVDFSRLVTQLADRGTCSVTSEPHYLKQSIELLLAQEYRQRGIGPGACHGECHVERCVTCPETGYLRADCR
jgi:hypothetical protein